jgi:hypothetical protein
MCEFCRSRRQLHGSSSTFVDHNSNLGLLLSSRERWLQHNHSRTPHTSFSLPWSHPQSLSPLPFPLSLSHLSTTARTSITSPNTSPNKHLSSSYPNLLASTPASFAASTSQPLPHIGTVSSLITLQTPVQQQFAVAGGGNDTCSLMLESTKSRVGSSKESRLCFIHSSCPLFF